jgi:AcrR family transcriptional regulator
VPRLIDRDRRQRELAEATWRVIQRDGVSGVSVRDVAAEAGLAVGSLRHVFSTKAGLLAYSMELVHRRAADRMRAHQSIPDPLELVRRTLAELLPLDATRRAEMEVNIALIAESPTDPRLKQLALAAQNGIRDACIALLTMLRQADRLHSDRDVDREARRLHSLVDGLAMHLIVDPDLSEDYATAALDDHLGQLSAPSAAGSGARSSSD